MINIDKDEVHGWGAAIRGMRNPMNSWDRIDSYFGDPYLEDFDNYVTPHVGENDLDLMRRLAKSGTDHRKFMRMITVHCDITAPLYWWKEFDTYKVGTIANSCSTMHKIHAKEFTLDDFSHEHLLDKKDFHEYGGDVIISLKCSFDDGVKSTRNVYFTPLSCLDHIIVALNEYRELYIETKDKKYWWQMIQLLPSSYNQKRTIMLNYEVLANMYKSRKNHKLDEWRYFCDWIKSLPYSEIIIGKE